MATPYAFVTLVTSDSYLPGALALVAALNELHPSPPASPEVDFQTVCLVTPETVDVSSIKLLRQAFNVVVGVEIIEQEDDKNLRLLGRPDLNTVLTKLHIFRLTQYSKIIFLDADVLPIRPLSHLFTLPHEFSAVPDVGWPDIFNSGVMVATPGEDKFNELTELQHSKGSWDGGDQGLLNEWRGQNWNRLSFIYNTTPTAAYTYAPAYERFGSGISAIHFIGDNKPWKSLPWRAPGAKSTETTLDNGAKRVYNYEALVDRWYDVYDRHYRSGSPPPQRKFEIQRYTSAWDEGGSVGADTQTNNAAPPPAGGSMDLEDLRKVAVGGLQAVNVPETAAPAPSEGEYRSMPLEGRIDLMRPHKQPEAGDQGGDRPGSPSTPRPTHVQMPAEEQGYFRMDTYPTPAPHEVPSAPYLPSHSLPPTAASTPYYGPPAQEYAGLFDDEHREAQHEGHHVYQPQPQPYYPYVPPGRADRPGDSSDSDTPRTSAVQRIPPYRQHVTREGHHSQSGAQGGQYPDQREQQVPGHHHVHRHHRQDSQQQPWTEAGQPASPQQYYEEQSQYGSHQGQRQYGGHSHHHRGSEEYASPEVQSGSQWQEGQGGVHRHHHHAHHHSHPSERHRGHQEQAPPPPPPRPISPPRVAWNPAVEPPPNEPPRVSAFPEDTYFQNIWDQTPSKHNDATFQSPQQSSRADVFFHPPPPSVIPEQLIREGQYANVLGSSPQQHESPEAAVAPPTPDRKSVHAVFPWEEKPRHRPRRVFPRTDSPPPAANYIESERTSSPIATPPPSDRGHSRVQSPTSPVNLPWGLGFSNAWDSVPSIQRYASKLAGSPKIFPHQFMMQAPPVVPEDGWRKWEKQRERDWQERQDASSMDGDDEDEGDEDEEGASEGSSKSKSSSRQKSRALSSRSTKRYRARGIQASPDTSEDGVQCTLVEEKSVTVNERVSVEVETEAIPANAPCPLCGRSCAPDECVAYRSRSPGFGARKWSSVPDLLPSAVPRDFRPQVEQMAGTPIATANVRSGVPFPSMASPTGARSPATLGSPRTYSPPQVVSPIVASPRRGTSPKVLSPVKGSSPSGSPSRILSPPPAEAPHSILSPRPSASPRQVMSPRRLSSSSSIQVSSRTSPVIGTASRALQSTPSPKLTRLSSLSSPQSPMLQRSISAETAATPSPSTTHESLITPENTPIGPRRAARVWDPARGVDVFKRGSEEVLARFLRMGSFDEEEGKRQAV